MGDFLAMFLIFGKVIFKKEKHFQFQFWILKDSNTVKIVFQTSSKRIWDRSIFSLIKPKHDILLIYVLFFVPVANLKLFWNNNKNNSVFNCSTIIYILRSFYWQNSEAFLPYSSVRVNIFIVKLNRYIKPNYHLFYEPWIVVW